MSDPIVTLVVPGSPRGKGRPRFRIVKPRGKSQFVTVYTDAETVAHEALIARAGTMAMEGRGPLEGALTVLVEAFMDIPPSWPQKKQFAAASGEFHHTSKPDLDNIAKIAADSLNKIAWVDDSQIVSMTVIKRYADYPRLRVSIWMFDDVEPEQKEMI